ncbi:DNase I-like protein [Zopfia rhizophila CBS 207.26]|uniref:DNA-(apurinic or apyrimidinic site) endonuclease 2 n=1 Tax=Zopfia rhizophila CBS 207.26 TaxID=1314779 RepID=A0A6A6DAQ3_9PEZI|nr:DNase I-like protein [Zopfia rhizophila CBS 207.26]
MVRITTWNVNGIRNPFSYQPWREKRTFDAMFDTLEADIVIMQELKIQRKDLRDDMVLVPGWDCYFSLPKHKKGYSGVGIYTRQSVCAPIRAEEGLLGVLCPPGSSTPYREFPENASIGGYPTALQVADLGVDPAALDAEGRCMVLEFPAFVLFGIYSPANSNGLRDDFRYGFICALDTRIRNLERMGKRVILTGDLNVSRGTIDTAKAEDNIKQEGITLEEYFNAPNRRIFNQLLENGKVPGERDEGREKPVLWDICREFHPKREGMFTHWEQKINARPGNFGSRIDYVLCSIEMKAWFSDSNIQEGLMGSDHCPVYATMKEQVDLRGKQVHILDIMNPPGMFKDGKRLRDINPAKDLLPLSGKLLPEFDRRRSIKDMFTKKPTLLTSKSTVDSSAGPYHNGAANIPDVTTTKVSGFDTANPQDTRAPSATPSNVSPLNSPEKRRPVGSPAMKPVKRSKSSVGTSTSQGLPKCQQSLKGFFAPKSTVSKSDSISNADSQGATDKPAMEPGETSTHNSTLSFNGKPPPEADPLESSPTTEPSVTPTSTISDTIIDPIATKESWTKLFSKKPPPRCEGHSEPCISLTTKKPGINCGRLFWICPRPLGPSGQKEKGTQWRCGTFIWASDWNAPGAS